MIQPIGVVVIILLVLLIVLLFRPILSNNEGEEFFRSGTSVEEQRLVQRESIQRRIQDLNLDRDSGKLSPEDWEALVAPLSRELERLPGDQASATAPEKPRNVISLLFHMAAGVALSGMTVATGLTLAGTLVGLSAIPLMAEETEQAIIQGTIRNGTTGQPTGADRVELLRIGESLERMESLQVIEPAEQTFRFKPADRKGAPLLIRATYRGDTFVAVIPPAEQTGPETPAHGDGDPSISATGRPLNNGLQITIPVSLTVFERGATMKDMEIRSGLQISRIRDALDITLVYAVSNRSNPPRSFFQPDLLLPVPAEARNLTVTLTHQATGMPTPLGTVASTGGVRFTHALRPGSSELSVHFRIDGHVFQDRKDFSAETFSNPSTVRQNKDALPFFRVLIWRPSDARPVIQGGTINEFEIPNLGKALQVTYADEPVTYRFERGSIWYDDPMKSDSNPIFDSPWKSALGLVLGLAILLLILSLLASTGGRSRRRESSELNSPQRETEKEKEGEIKRGMK